MTEVTDLSMARDILRQRLGQVDEGIVVLTGAGISTESGIPDFRSPGGIWSRTTPVQYRDFVGREESRRQDWSRRFEMRRYFQNASPNAAHLALSELARSGRLSLLITQNVDGLHQASGIAEEQLIELHGNSTYAKCLSCGSRAELEDCRPAFDAGTSPTCSDCGGLLKAAVVSFGQAMPEIALNKAAEAARDADLFLVIGSSLLVHPAAELPVLAARSGADLIILNREPTPVDALACLCIRTPIAESFAGFQAPDVT